MVMVGLDSVSLQVDSQPKSFGLVWGFAATWRHSTFIKWTGWTFTVALPWWQHHKRCHLYCIIIVVIISVIQHCWSIKVCRVHLIIRHVTVFTCFTFAAEFSMIPGKFVM